MGKAPINRERKGMSDDLATINYIFGDIFATSAGPACRATAV
jgi:hypothetical protein